MSVSNASKKRFIDDSDLSTCKPKVKESIILKINPDIPLPFSSLALILDKVSEIKGEISKEKIKNILADFFSQVISNRKQDLVKTYYFCILKLSPDYIPSDLGIGDSILMKAISKVTARTEKNLREAYNNIGDLGTIAMESKKN